MPRPASPPPRLLSAAAKAAQDGWTVRIWREGQPPITVAVDEGGADKVASNLSNEESECDALFGINR